MKLLAWQEFHSIINDDAKQEKMVGNVKKWFGTRKNEPEQKKMSCTGKKWSGPKKNELYQEKMVRTKKIIK